MNTQDIIFHIEGKNSETIAKEIKKIIEHEFDIKTDFTPAASNGSRKNVKGIDPVAVAAVIISIPSAIIATIDLLERRKNKKKLDTILEESQKIVRKNKKVTIKITSPDGTTKEIHRVDSVSLIDAAK